MRRSSLTVRKIAAVTAKQATNASPIRTDGMNTPRISVVFWKRPRLTAADLHSVVQEQPSKAAKEQSSRMLQLHVTPVCGAVVDVHGAIRIPPKVSASHQRLFVAASIFI